MENQTYGSWTVIDSTSNKKWLVECKCGYRASRVKQDLVSGKSRGCNACRYKARKGAKSPKVTKHGLADSPTQTSWTEMKRRCTQPHRRGYENYGGRGITVCDRWLFGDGDKSAFHCFVEDMGERPDIEHQIDRIDNDGNYTPENCRWVHKNQQVYNRQDTVRIEAFGRVMTMQEACQTYSISYGTLISRLKTHKMPPEVALTKPVIKRVRKETTP